MTAIANKSDQPAGSHINIRAKMEIVSQNCNRKYDILVINTCIRWGPPGTRDQQITHLVRTGQLTTLRCDQGSFWCCYLNNGTNLQPQ